MAFGQLRVYPSSPLWVLPLIPLTEVSIDIEARVNAMKTLLNTATGITDM